jgi:tRNA threonylcarbamoyladenosine biosynthesis protein TsaB
MLDAGRDRFATALYERHNGQLRRHGDIVGIGLEELADVVDGPCVVCGDLNNASRERLQAMLGEAVVVASPAASLRRPGILAELAWEQHQADASGEPWRLEPLYLSRE